jgi:hypothetical protein
LGADAWVLALEYIPGFTGADVLAQVLASELIQSHPMLHQMVRVDLHPGLLVAHAFDCKGVLTDKETSESLAVFGIFHGLEIMA